MECTKSEKNNAHNIKSNNTTKMEGIDRKSFQVKLKMHNSMVGPVIIQSEPG